MTKKKLLALFAPAVIVLILDQLTKWIIRTDSSFHNLTIIEGWLEFNYVQNEGMALGIDILSTPVISSIAIVATIGITIYVLFNMSKTNIGYLVMMGLILGGAFGNITDRLIMGIIEGYGTVLEGHVVDFIHFNLRINDWPVFPYIFNVADIAISVSIISLLLFNKRLLPTEDEIPKEEAETEAGVFDSPVMEPIPFEENKTGLEGNTES